MSELKAQVTNKLHTLATLAQAGIIRPMRPDRLVEVAAAVKRWGATPAAGYTASALRYPDEIAIIDELGTLTFREVHERSNALARELAADGIKEGDSVGLMCRNHRGFIEAVVACSKLGTSVVFLNTAFSAPQLADVAERETPRALIYDQEFADVLKEAGRRRKRYIAWSEPDVATKEPLLEDLIARGARSNLDPPSKPGKAIILTSGTTGTPKGASRSQPKSLDPAAALLSRIPLRARGKTMIAAPLFHSWGFAHFSLGLSLSSTYVLKRKFDPETTLSLTAQHECSALVVVPVMLQRILELPDEVLDRYDLASVKAVPASGSALPGPLAQRWMDHFGDNLYNLYGSTEVAWATIATPQDLRAAPGTAGKPPRGTVVRLYDDDGKPVEKQGDTGRIFVGNEMQFEGYTGGGGKDVIDGLMSSGDVGHFDAEGRLFIDGRDDDMIVSGGENVFPAEVEDLLAGHDGIGEVAVFGVDDDEFGQRLKACVVTKPGAELTEDEVKAYVKSNLAGYKVPRDVEFIDELPRTSTGKVLKRELS
ncbi:MAG: Long-chain-fatty-acid--CoA ligase [uncultured Solirubrobacteraceae bacterium]|uniref:Long-chain-fatty-acid--CoA ligase n=1 Tax=uncultured Solirubrobacteraceae bacterium TaxID=1162706 RepID=A0A6J4TRQ8_9ACTN|nr:MAG: Long-chain-fatty-acid--CoA ligase [uncultured Solirubrobacteraceae bacterium]